MRRMGSSTYLSFILLLLTLYSVAVGSAAEQPPVCLPTDTSCHPTAAAGECALYMAESTDRRDTLSLFLGVDRAMGERIVDPDLVLSIIDPNKNEYSTWHDYAWEAYAWPGFLLENSFLHNVLIPGIGAMSICSNTGTPNVRFEGKEVTDSAGVHRSSDPTAGSFSYHHNFGFAPSRQLKAGDELFADCSSGGQEDTSEEYYPERRHSLEWLKLNGVCVDNLSVAKSTLPGVGRGAFAKRAVGAGEVVALTPVLHFDRSQVEILKQQYKEEHLIPLPRDHGIEYTEQVVGKQLLLNYCYGLPGSNVLLFPYAPGVNFINHNREKANAYVRWSTAFGDDSELKDLHHMELYETPIGEEGTLGIDFVALRDIEPGEEVLIDYGDAWVDAWEKHVSEWNHGRDKEYVSAADYNRLHKDEGIRTKDEQERNPYPDNLRTACYFAEDEENIVGGEQKFEWSEENFDCLRPCDVTERVEEGGTTTYYTAVVHSMENLFEPDKCGTIPKGGVTVSKLPMKAVTIVDKPYTSDTHLRDSFRHEIGLPDGFYPDNWMAADPMPYGDFIASPLAPGQIAPIRWQGTAEVVTPWAFRMGVSEKVRKVLLDYCNKMGITDIFRHVTMKDNSLEIGTETYVDLHGFNWYLQRPDNRWRSNLHWLSPGDNAAHEDYLQALSAAGFDENLKSVGEYLGMDGLVAFHVTFIAVSHATKGYMHNDVQATGAKTYNCIIPLILANDTGPELDLADANYEDEDEASIGRYRYEYGVASMMGDMALHGTSAVDYRAKKEMRLAATVYIADVNEENAGGILAEYTQAYPPRDRSLLLGWAGRHWKKDDPSRKLPKPGKDHVLMQASTTE